MKVSEKPMGTISSKMSKSILQMPIRTKLATQTLW